MSFYKISCSIIKNTIEQIHGPIEPREHIGKLEGRALLEDMLWMIQEMANMNTMSEEELSKASRWIGWMFRTMEELGYFTNADSRNLARQDKQAGYHIRH